MASKQDPLIVFKSMIFFQIDDILQEPSIALKLELIMQFVFASLNYFLVIICKNKGGFRASKITMNFLHRTFNQVPNWNHDLIQEIKNFERSKFSPSSVTFYSTL